jgi:hypothetical protein
MIWMCRPHTPPRWHTVTQRPLQVLPAVDAAHLLEGPLAGSLDPG